MGKEVEQKLYHIFTAGEYIIEGDKVVFTNDDVAEIAASYDIEFHEANLHVGHPETEEPPALGWIGGLKADGKKLFCWFSWINDEGKKLVNDKYFKKCSVEIVKFISLGKKYLWGLGLTNLPRVENLPDLSFSKKAKEDIEKSFAPIHQINFSENNISKSNNTKMSKTISEFITKFAQAIGINVSNYATDEAVLEDAANIISGLQAKFADDPDAVGSLSMYISRACSFIDENKKLKTENAEFQKKEVQHIVDMAVALGKILPAQKEKFLKYDAKMLNDFIGDLPVKTMFKNDIVAGKEVPTEQMTAEKFKNTDGSPYTYQQFVKDFTNPDKSEFVSQFNQSEIEKLPGYDKGSAAVKK